MATSTPVSGLTAITNPVSGAFVFPVLNPSDTSQGPNGSLQRATATQVFTNLMVTTTATVTGTSASTLAVGANGATNPVLKVDASTASVIAGLQLKGAVTGGTVALTVIDSGSAANLSVDAKGTGTVAIGTTSTGNVTIGSGPVLTVSSTGIGVSGTTKQVATDGRFFFTGIYTGTNGDGSLYADTTHGVILRGRTGATNAIVLQTNSGSAALTIPQGTVNVVGSGSVTSSSPSAGIGYSAGAGSSVNQSTDKTTAVTINAVSGAITTASGTINAGFSSQVTFTVTNSSVRTGDTVSVCHASGGTAGAYIIWAHSIVNATSFKISILNASGGGLSEQPVINFNLIRGTSS